MLNKQAGPHRHSTSFYPLYTFVSTRNHFELPPFQMDQVSHHTKYYCRIRYSSYHYLPFHHALSVFMSKMVTPRYDTNYWLR